MGNKFIIHYKTAGIYARTNFILPAIWKKRNKTQLPSDSQERRRESGWPRYCSFFSSTLLPPRKRIIEGRKEKVPPPPPSVNRFPQNIFFIACERKCVGIFRLDVSINCYPWSEISLSLFIVLKCETNVRRFQSNSKHYFSTKNILNYSTLIIEVKF